MKKYMTRVAAVGALTVAVAGVTGTAYVLNDRASTPGNTATARYSDREIIDGLVFGSGRVVQDHPDLKTEFPLRSGAPVNARDREMFTDRVLHTDPAFHSDVTVRLQSGDPYAVNAALGHMRSSVHTAAYDTQDPQPQMPDGGQAMGIAWHDSNVVTEQNVAAVWQAAAAHTVAVAAGAAVVVYIAPAVASYEFRVNSADPIQKSALVAVVTKDLA